MISQLVLLLLLLTVEQSLPKRLYHTSYVYMAVVDKTNGERLDVCANYQQFKYEQIASDFESAPSYNLKFWMDRYKNTNVCPYGDGFDYSGAVVPLQFRIEDDHTPCTKPFVESSTSFRQASQFQEDVLIDANASAAIFLLTRGLQFVNGWRDFLFNDFYDPYINKNQSIPTFYLYNHVFEEKILALSPDPDNFSVRFFRPPSFPIDPSMIIIWFIAMGCVTGGGVWAFFRHKWGKDSQVSEVIERMNGLDSAESEEETTQCTEKYGSWLSIAFLMGMLVGIIMIGYYFRSYIVIFFNLMVAIFGSITMFECFKALILNLSFMQAVWEKLQWKTVRFPFMTERLVFNLPGSILYSACAAFCACWYCKRLEPYAFIGLDTINITVCLHILKSLRLPSLKWISTLMLAMFVYDAIMVFATPLWTTNGCSVMLEVATGIDCSTKGNGSGYPLPPIDTKTPEKFPMLMQVPHIDPMISCIDLEVEKGYQMSILGLGDIVVPGYLVSHTFTMHGFDEKVRMIYGLVCVIGYGVGLMATFAALLLMEMAQPALIYLVPFTLIPICLLAWFRGEFHHVWNGYTYETAPAACTNEPGFDFEEDNRRMEAFDEEYKPANF